MMDLKKFLCHVVHSSYNFVSPKLLKMCPYQFLTLIQSLQFMPFKFISPSLLPQLLEKNHHNIVIIFSNKNIYYIELCS